LIAGYWAAAFGQIDRANTGALSAGATANYRFAEASELAITVTLLGSVERPGRYEVSSKVDLVNLLALAGGWTENADMSDVRITREKTPNDPTNRFQLRLNLENLTEVSPKFLELQDGDCVYVGKSSSVTLPLVLSIVSSAATVAIAVAYFTVINR
jgi:protein involved in polysaccharide export with SLBB domain